MKLSDSLSLSLWTMIAICHNYDAIIPLSPCPQLAKGAAELVPGLHIRSPYTFQSISTTVVQSTWLSCLTLLQDQRT